MGYTTNFEGNLKLNRPLSTGQAAYLRKFFEIRHMKRLCPAEYGIEGEFYVEDDQKEILDHNEPPLTQPELWCDLELLDDRLTIVWNGSEKTYSLEKWIAYIIDAFLKNNGFILNGTLDAQGEEPGDVYKIIVKDNEVYLKEGDTFTKILQEPLKVQYLLTEG